MKIGEIFKISLFQFSKYNRLLLAKKTKVFIYLVLLALIMLLGVAVRVSPLYFTYSSIEKFVEKECPEFAITDGKLTCKPYLFDEPSANLYIEIAPDKTGEGELPKGYSQAAVITSTDMVIRNNFRVQRESFKDIKDFSKNTIVNFFNKYEKKLIAGLAILLFFVFLIRLAFNALIYAFIAFVANIIFVHANLKYGDVYKLTVFGGTFAVLFNVVVSFFNVSIIAQLAPFITLFYVIKGMYSCRGEDGIVIETLDTPEDINNGSDDFL